MILKNTDICWNTFRVHCKYILEAKSCNAHIAGGIAYLYKLYLLSTFERCKSLDHKL